MENTKKRTRPDLAERNRQNATHGMTSSKTYRIWVLMRDRCCNQKSKDYPNYGGRGIKICEEWNRSFVCFLQDMGECPENMQIDRINNNGNYEKSNCRWTTLQINANNRRTCVYVDFNGKSQSIADWARETGIERKTLEYRIRTGWPVEKALTTPSLIPRKQ